MLKITLNVVHILIILQSSHEVGTTVVSISQLRKLKHREIKYYTQGYITSTW